MASTPVLEPGVRFFFIAQIVRWIDADSVLVRPLVYRRDIFLRIRLRDIWAPEIGEDGADLALQNAKALLGDTGAYIGCQNVRHNWPYERLEARLDPFTM